ncbi:DegT/DnrJ/EryC1/StrS family aminotransferase [Phenylobacterium sp.]|uniref:DegT/DnrJ/EryC1/StrS family aminotransferase n=1 Tax=Phenylobacterium sp. TaxID=1871053 RepID=UPI0035AE704C
MRFFDLGLEGRSLRLELREAFERVLDSGWVILGPEVEAFEAEFAAVCGVEHAIGVGNGLDALTLALRAAGVGPGSEVIAPSHTFVATWLAVEAVGARVRPVEPDPLTLTIDPAAVAAAVNDRTAAILPVSLYGHPVDIEPLMAVAERYGLFVLEDAAQAHGAAYHGRPVGSLAHATAFSFYPTKNLGALGDAGAVTTSDAAFADRLRLLRNYGSRQKYLHEVSGVNSRLDELQAAFLRVRLRHLAEANARRRERAAVYTEHLRDLPVVAPREANWATHVYHLYVIRSQHRDALQANLSASGIETLVHYPRPCHLQPAFAHLGFRAGDFPLAERLASEVLSLPLWPEMPLEAVKEVARAVRAG